MCNKRLLVNDSLKASLAEMQACYLQGTSFGRGWVREVHTNDFMQTDNVGVAEGLHYWNLSYDLWINSTFTSSIAWLWQQFQGIQCQILGVQCQFDNPKWASAQGAYQGILIHKCDSLQTSKTSLCLHYYSSDRQSTHKILLRTKLGMACPPTDKYFCCAGKITRRLLSSDQQGWKGNSVRVYDHSHCRERRHVSNLVFFQLTLLFVNDLWEPTAAYRICINQELRGVLDCWSRVAYQLCHWTQLMGMCPSIDYPWCFIQGHCRCLWFIGAQLVCALIKLHVPLWQSIWRAALF